jgi:acetyl-CoA synthetase
MDNLYVLSVEIRSRTFFSSGMKRGDHASGYRIGPFEVESALIEHPAVQAAAVVGSPDDIRGLIVKAFVILKPGIKPSEGLIREIQNHAKRVTAPYKYPRAIEFVESLPKTVSGKIKRNELRDREMKRSLNGNNAGKGV